MPDALRVDRARGIVEIRSYGTVSKSDIAASIARVESIAAEETIKRVLVDTTEQESLPSTIDLFELFSTFPTDIAIAVVSTGQSTAKDIHFIETVAVNRGILIRMFRSREDAEEWLCR